MSNYMYDNGGRTNGGGNQADDVVFAGTLYGPVFVGDDQPYDSLPWYRKTPFAVAFMVVAGFVSTAFVVLLIGRGANDLISRGYTFPSILEFWIFAFILIWGACTILNVARTIKFGASRIGAFDLASGTVSPALTTGGLMAYPLYLMASPVFATLVGVIILIGTVLIIRKSIDQPLESTSARIAEVGAVLGTFLLIAFLLYTI